MGAPNPPEAPTAAALARALSDLYDAGPTHAANCECTLRGRWARDDDCDLGCLAVYDLRLIELGVDLAQKVLNG